MYGTEHPLVRTIYLYLMALVGLVLLIIGGIHFIDMGLKVSVFTEADKEETLYSKQPPIPPTVYRIQDLEEGKDVQLSASDKELLYQWLSDYEEWQKRMEELDPVVARRQREASQNLAMVLVGLPLYIYHWRIIRRELRGGQGQ
ncbi:MAG: hypothetical protein ACOC58_02445 [Chloroflexota bacterium]